MDLINEMFVIQSTVMILKKAIPVSLSLDPSGLHGKDDCIQSNLRWLIGSVVRHRKIHVCIRTEYEITTP